MTMSGFVAKWCTGIGILQIKQLSHETNIFWVSFSKILSAGLVINKFLNYYFGTHLKFKRRFLFFGTFSIMMNIGRNWMTSGEPCCWREKNIVIWRTGDWPMIAGDSINNIRRVSRFKEVLVTSSRQDHVAN